jgi:pimeloyl-ACP methyl ester carboxylesterase
MGATLARDAAGLAPNDPAGPGPLGVEAQGLILEQRAERFPVALYRPHDLAAPLPAVVFLPGYLAPEDQYESYARALASRGFLVAVSGRVDPFASDRGVADVARRIADWLIARQGADPEHIGVAGHSMGGKDAVLAALEDPRFRAVVALDPDDRGEPSVIHGALAKLAAPLLLIGAQFGAKAASICADVGYDYRRFFASSPPGTTELTLLAADHVQVMDDPDRFGLGICRCGTADSRAVRILARRATVRFFLERLAGVPQRPLDLDGIGALRVQPPAPGETAAGL